MSKVTIPEGTHGFPLGVSVEIDERDGSKYVTIHSRLHVNKARTLPHCYSADWTTWEILRDSSFLKYLSRYR